MGIGLHEMQLLRAAGGRLGEVLTFGRQGISLPNRAVERLIGEPVRFPEHGYCEALLEQAFGATRVASLDNSDYEGGTYVGDLNAPVDLGRTFDTVIDFGTSEHVFDIAAALRNAIHLCRVGGRILHALPANGECGHGLYQFSPALFLSLYHGNNGFAGTRVWVAKLVDERHWWRVLPPRPGQRVTANAAPATYLLCLTSKVRDVASLSVQQSDYVRAWEAGEPARSIERPHIERVRDVLKSSVVADGGNVAYRSLFFKGGLTRYNDHLHRVLIADEVAAGSPAP